jgi:putative hemolysin
VTRSGFVARESSFSAPLPACRVAARRVAACEGEGGVTSPAKCEGSGPIGLCRVPLPLLGEEWAVIPRRGTVAVALPATLSCLDIPILLFSKETIFG